MTDRLRVGVVGVGHLGRHHARLYAASSNATLVGVADCDEERARAIADEFGCEAFTDARDLVGRVRAASVVVPTEHHRDVAEVMLRGGVDVMIEKPIARTVEEAQAINRLARDCSRRVMVGHTERFNPAVMAMARAVDAPRFFEIHRLAAFSARSTDIDVVLDLMIHDLDLLLYLDGSDAVSVDAVGVSALTDKVDIANARIRLASGCVANLTASRISADAIRRVRVFQAHNYISCDTGKRSVEAYRLVPGEGAFPRIKHEFLPVEQGEPLALELEAFIDAVRRQVVPPIDGLQGQRALDLAFRVREAIDRSAQA